MDARGHTTTVVGLLTAAGLRVYPGGAPDDPVFPYVAVYVDGGRNLATSMGQAPDQWDVTVQTTSVGTTHEQCLWAAGKVSGALAGVRPAVSGFTNSRFEHLYAAPVAVDYDAPTDVRYKVDQWRTRALTA